MPEEPEVETERLHEAINEELEKGGGAFLKRIALTTALLAALAAIASLKAGATVNEALVLKTEATRLQAQASDEWAYYQAKGIKAAIEKASESAWLAAGKRPSEESETRIKRYGEEQIEIEKKAREAEKERDEKSRKADDLLHRHNGFPNAVALFQVTIALFAVTALTRVKPVWFSTMLVALVGSGFFGRVL